MKVGVRKFVLPVDVRVLNSDGYMFLSIPSTSEIFSISGKSLTAMDAAADATEAYAALNVSRKRRKAGGRKRAELPAEIGNVLKGLPEGYRIGYDAAGNPRLVRKRVRSKKA